MKRTTLFALLAVALAMPGTATAQMTGTLKCADIHVDGNNTYNPSIVIENGCEDVVFWALCLRYSSNVDPEYFDGTLQPGEDSWIETYPQVGEKFTFLFRFQTMSSDVEYPAC